MPDCFAGVACLNFLGGRVAVVASRLDHCLLFVADIRHFPNNEEVDASVKKRRQEFAERAEAAKKQKMDDDNMTSVGDKDDATPNVLAKNAPTGLPEPPKQD